MVVDREQDVARLLTQATALARAQSETTGIPYRQIVLFSMQGTEPTVQRVRPGTPASGTPLRRDMLATAETMVPPDFALYLVTVPSERPLPDVRDVLLRLALFQEESGVRGHIVLLGRDVPAELYGELQSRLAGATIIAMPS